MDCVPDPATEAGRFSQPLVDAGMLPQVNDFAGVDPGDVYPAKDTARNTLRRMRSDGSGPPSSPTAAAG